MNEIANAFYQSTGIEIAWTLGIVAVLILSLVIMTQGKLMVAMFGALAEGKSTDLGVMDFLRCVIVMAIAVAGVSGIYFTVV